MTEFKHIHPALAPALIKRGYDTLTQVQEAVIEPEILGEDMLVSAQTGSGKTVAFGLAMASTLLGEQTSFERAKSPLALIIAPTRELALQVKRELEWLYVGAGARIASCVGGMDMRTERKDLSRGAHIVVGTPGRLLDHLNRKTLNLNAIRAVVLDEADEMLDMGFRDDLEEILSGAPSERQTLLFSATVPKSIAGLARKYQNNAVRVNTAAEQKQHVDIEYKALMVMPKDQENAIVNVLRFYEAQSAIVFCQTRAAVNRMTSRFNNRGFSVVALSGELSQKERSSALQSLRDGRARVCIATDVAARGLDLPNLGLVIHADLPKNGEGLLHRSGRTGRAGRKGVSVLIVPVKARKRALGLLRSAKVEASWENAPSMRQVVERDQERLLSDPMLSESHSDKDYEFARGLIERFGAEQVAAAFVKQFSKGRSAPEELAEVSATPSDSVKKKRAGMTNGVWFHLSSGRNQKMEPRWILPWLRSECRLNKREVGAIVIATDDSHLELSARGAEKFLDVVGAEMKFEGIEVVLVGEKPANLEDPRDNSNYKSRQQTTRERNQRGQQGQHGRKQNDRKQNFKSKGSQNERSQNEGPKSDFNPDGKPSKKKKPHKKKLARAAVREAAAAKASRQGQSQSSNDEPYLKRKKRKPN